MVAPNFLVYIVFGLESKLGKPIVQMAALDDHVFTFLTPILCFLLQNLAIGLVTFGVNMSDSWTFSMMAVWAGYFLSAIASIEILVQASLYHCNTMLT